MELRANEHSEVRLPVAAEETWDNNVPFEDQETKLLDQAAEQATLLRMAALVPERKQEMLPNGEEMNASDPRPLREYFLQHPSAEVRFDFDVARVQQTVAEYATLRDAVAPYVPELRDMQLPTLAALRAMTDGAANALVHRIMKFEGLHPVGVRFSVLAETLRAAPAEMFATDDEGEDYALAAK